MDDGGTKPLFSSLFSSRQKTDNKLDFVEPNIVDGKPRAWISKKVVDEGKMLWEGCLIGYFLDRRVAFIAMKEAITRMWNLKGSLEIFSMENGFYMFRFS